MDQFNQTGPLKFIELHLGAISASEDDSLFFHL